MSVEGVQVRLAWFTFTRVATRLDGVEGGVLSVETAFLTLKETPLEVVVFPAWSRATAVMVWVPLATVVLFQTMEYGALRSSVPILVPSSLNWTPTTERLSKAVVVRETLEPITEGRPEGGLITKETVGVVIVGAWISLKVAVTETGLVTVTLQFPVPVQLPDQPPKANPPSGAALRVTGVPLAKAETQVEPQVMPAGLDVTVP